MNFTIKEIKRAYRDINNIMDDVLSTDDMNLYKTYVSRFISEIEENPVLKFILEPYFNIETDVIKERNHGYRLELSIPADINIQIAFVLQILKEFSENSPMQICSFLYRFFGNKKLSDNIYPWNSNLVSPVFRDISVKIQDLIDDIPNDVTEVEGKYMTIINFGNYNSTNGQVANGNNNTLSQNINSEDIFKELINKVNESVKENDKEEIINLIETLRAEQGKVGFKEILGKFIEKTAKYSSVFMELWSKLNELGN